MTIYDGYGFPLISPRNDEHSVVQSPRRSPQREEGALVKIVLMNTSHLKITKLLQAIRATPPGVWRRMRNRKELPKIDDRSPMNEVSAYVVENGGGIVERVEKEKRLVMGGYWGEDQEYQYVILDNPYILARVPQNVVGTIECHYAVQRVIPQ